MVVYIGRWQVLSRLERWLCVGIDDEDRGAVTSRSDSHSRAPTRLLLHYFLREVTQVTEYRSCSLLRGEEMRS